MSVELIKKPINVYQPIDEQQKEELMETGMIVPDSKPDVLNVLVIDTDVVVKTREKTGRVMEVGGEICYQLLYRADNQEQSLESIHVKSPWSISCNYPVSEEQIYTLVKAGVEHTDIEIVNGRKLSARSVVKLSVRYLMAKSIEAGEAVAGDRIYQKADNVEMTTLENLGERTLNVAENVDLEEGKPVMEEMVYTHASLREVKVNENQNLQAMLELDCLYRADNDNKDIENLHFDIPINRSLDIENDNYSELSVNAGIKSVSVKPDEDLDGLLTRVKIDIEIGVEYGLYSKETVHLVKDAYGLDYDFDLEKNPVNVGVDERDIRDVLQVSSSLSLDCDGETLEEVIHLTLKPRLLSAQKDGAAIDINGCLDVCVLYGTGMQLRIIRGSNQEMAFNHRLSLPETDTSYDYDLNLCLDNSNYEIVSDTELDIKAQVEVRAHISKKQSINIVTGVKGVKPIEKKENPPLLIYYAQQGDNLWTIARKYRVPIQKILDDNGMVEEKDPTAGEKILLLG